MVYLPLTAPPNSGEMGVIYLICFDRPFGTERQQAEHYLGWAGPGGLDERLAAHACGQGARLLRHVRAAGIGWTVVRTWEGDRNEERRLKNRGGHGRKCPLHALTSLSAGRLFAVVPAQTAWPAA